MFFFFSSRRRHTRFKCDWSSDVCSSDLFMPENSVSLDERFNVAKSGTEVSVEKRHEILIVEFSKPPSILLNPDLNCFYQRVSAGGGKLLAGPQSASVGPDSARDTLKERTSSP